MALPASALAMLSPRPVWTQQPGWSLNNESQSESLSSPNPQVASTLPTVKAKSWQWSTAATGTHLTPLSLGSYFLLSLHSAHGTLASWPFFKLVELLLHQGHLYLQMPVSGRLCVPDLSPSPVSLCSLGNLLGRPRLLIWCYTPKQLFPSALFFSVALIAIGYAISFSYVLIVETRPPPRRM